MPFIVRQEIGYQDRDQYKVLTLFTPGEAWSRWEPQPQWNHKLLVTGGGGCGAAYGAGDAPLDDLSGTLPPNPGLQSSYIAALGRGFAVMSTALANTGHNCNLATEAESLIMAKERLIENYGDVRYTIGTGCSGGSIVQQTVANAYPGAVYDGLVITCAYPDVLTAGAQFADYHLLRRYFEDPARTCSLWPGRPPQWGPVEGRPDPVNAIVADEALFKSATEPGRRLRAGGPGLRPGDEPGRRALLDPRLHDQRARPAPAQRVWSDMEQARRPRVRRPAVRQRRHPVRPRGAEQGLITPAQFVDLNATIGGRRHRPQPDARRGSPATTARSPTPTAPARSTR